MEHQEPNGDWRRMPRKRRSPIWLMPKDEFARLVAQSKSLSDVLRHFGMEHKGGNHRTLKTRLAHDGVDIRHIDLRPGALIAKRNKATQIPLDAILVENSSYTRVHLKRRLMKSGILKNECAVCGQGPDWLGKPLVLVLDHINGVPNDNRLENLRLLCPNCNSQTDTYCAKNYSKNSTARSGVV